MIGPLVALIDGPLDPGHPALAERRRFDPGGEGGPAARHAAAMAAAILAGAPEARLLNLVVFGGGLSTSAAAVAEALAAAREAGAAVVHCSLGLARDDPALRVAAAALVGEGRALVAAAPARGGPVFPAALPGAVAVQGDARCGPSEWSALDLPTAGWGACPSGDDPAVAGASVAAARFSGFLAARLGRGSTLDSALDTLRATARFHGRERRGHAAAQGG